MAQQMELNVENVRAWQAAVAADPATAIAEAQRRGLSKERAEAEVRTFIARTPDELVAARQSDRLTLDAKDASGIKAGVVLSDENGGGTYAPNSRNEDGSVGNLAGFVWYLMTGQIVVR